MIIEVFQMTESSSNLSFNILFLVIIVILKEVFPEHVILLSPGSWWWINHWWLKHVISRSTLIISAVQSLSHVRLFEAMDCSMPGLPVHHQLPEFTQIHIYWVSDAIQHSHPLLSPNPSQHQGPFQWVSFSHQVAKVLEFQSQHQSFQWTLMTDLL